MNRKLFLMLFIGLSSLVIFSVAMSVVSNPIASLTVNLETPSYFDIKCCFTLGDGTDFMLGDGIDTPSYP